MEKPIHALKDLFAQLGLPNDAAAIDAFIKAHSPLPETVKVADAPFWTTAQAAFLREELAEDADWAELVDQLSAALRAQWSHDLDRSAGGRRPASPPTPFAGGSLGTPTITSRAPSLGAE